MKLSEAIRAGAALRPQAVGYYFDRNDDGIICSCTSGAMWEALENPPPDTIRQIADGDFNEEEDITLALMRMLGTDAPWPGDWAWGRGMTWMEARPINILQGIAYLNDAVRLTREQIADILEQRGL